MTPIPRMMSSAVVEQGVFLLKVIAFPPAFIGISG
jgi:hypothetical protein